MTSSIISPQFPFVPFHGAAQGTAGGRNKMATQLAQRNEAEQSRTEPKTRSRIVSLPFLGVINKKKGRGEAKAPVNTEH